ncbi:hypothetical protein J42TS3_21320 [Paenibacillus vini]|uniref:Uncharacterized protein n=1 Tax=Paenibacillus vini TaxID=1476024 RepID=A0ABQ4MBT3_9BACL|nr:hypothetical protein J42TS3_21320 [Paenibacillus vini]
MLGYKHFIRTDHGGKVLHGFSTAFESPSGNDIMVNGNAERHFPINVLNAAGEPIYEFIDGKMVAMEKA